MSTTTQYAATLASVQEAAERIKPYVRRTPVFTSSTIDAMVTAVGRVGADNQVNNEQHVFFKCEPFQKGGAFKYRGACNAIFKLSEEQAKKGVVAHSSGNHAQAVALAARERRINATIIMPNNAPAVKRAAVEGYGATVIIVEPQDRDSECEKVAAETGATMIHPSNDPEVISGQGTMALEFLEQVQEEFGGVKLDVIVVPVGGGGMISGIAAAVKGLYPECVVIGAEPAEADDAHRSKAMGSLQRHKDGMPAQTVADGLRTTLGSYTFPIVRDMVDHIVLVSESDIVKGMRTIIERLKVVVEPSAGVGIGAILSEQGHAVLPRNAKNIGVILCGGNLDLDTLPQILEIESGANEIDCLL